MIESLILLVFAGIYAIGFLCGNAYECPNQFPLMEDMSKLNGELLEDLKKSYETNKRLVEYIEVKIDNEGEEWKKSE